MKKILSGLLVLSLSILVGCAAGGPPAAVGSWNSELNSPMGVLPITLTFHEDGSGELISDILNAPISDITYNGNTAIFSLEISVRGQEIALDFSGTAEGNALAGEFDSDFGVMGVTGTRK